MASAPTPDWRPFRVDNTRLFAPRAIHTREGIGDRLRTAAFAEVQAEAAFLWAARVFDDAPEQLREGWVRLAQDELRHREWLVARLAELGIALDERPVSDVLWGSLVRCGSAREFCHYIADAENRGKRAGERFHEQLLAIDPVTAEIFGRIAEEERSHIALAFSFFPAAPAPVA